MRRSGIVKLESLALSRVTAASEALVAFAPNIATARAAVAPAPVKSTALLGTRRLADGASPELGHGLRSPQSGHFGTAVSWWRAQPQTQISTASCPSNHLAGRLAASSGDSASGLASGSARRAPQFRHSRRTPGQLHAAGHPWQSLQALQSTSPGLAAGWFTASNLLAISTNSVAESATNCLTVTPRAPSAPLRARKSGSGTVAAMLLSFIEAMIS